jgi:DNA invertase Pin-like site-specific DNA recombinase
VTDPPRVAIYARVSTTEQSTDAQVDRLQSFCVAQGWGQALVFRDDGVSGVRDNRPQLDALRERTRRGEISAVVVTKMDRLGRSLGMILRFWDEADAAGVRVIVTDQGIDTSTPAGRFQRNMLAALAEFERELILERTQAGIARARAAGKRFGRPPKITEDQRAECLRRLSNGESSRAVSQALKIPAGTVRWIWREARLQSPPLPETPRVLRET